jgi:GNAT superfamily N-acetyltransferase
MIKLYDLFNEIELRKGQLEPEDVDDNYLYESFFSEFLGVDLNEKNLDLSKSVDSSVFNKIKKTVISEMGGYQLAVPSSFFGKTYILNPSANNFQDYIVGYIEIKKVYSNYKLTKAYKVKGAQVYLSFVSEPYRGKGVGTLAYKMLLEAYGTLFSDDILYEGSRNLWVSKIIPMVKEQGGFFGGEGMDMYIPLSAQDAADNEVASQIDRYMASLNPPSEVKKLSQLIGNVDIISGGLWVYALQGSNEELFDLINEYENDPTTNISDLIDENEEHFTRYLSYGDSPSACIVRTVDAVVVLTQTSKGVKATLL